MSARPRLVKEGVPIAFAGDNDIADILDDSDDDLHIEEHKAVPSSSGSSSLQKAARASCSKQRRSGSGAAAKIETSYVIGGDTVGTASTGSFIRKPQHSQEIVEHHTVTSTTIGHQNHSQHYYHQQQEHYPHQQQHHYHAQHHHVTIPPYQQQQHYVTSHDHMEVEEGHSYQSSNGNVHHHQHHHQHRHPQQHHHHPPATTITQTSYVIGGNGMSHSHHGNTGHIDDDRPVERMEGVEDLGTKYPLVVLDGANVAHHYAQAMAGIDGSSLSVAQTKPEPDARGIQVATDFFLQAGLRVLVVLPQYWFRTKPRPGDASSNNSRMETPQMEILNELKTKGLIVASPPTDDDDAYALTIARREETRSLSKRNGEGPGFVLSNDLFRDAQERDTSGSLKHWLKHGRHESVGPGRISYTFGDMGTMDDRGERILDFIPNPRHPLMIW
eukprot:CAMPEP_0178833908 /NCGR_PEP_ID=MMETSP0746-20121128/10802_1 /TAXON_ID=913974 /ORGANISM="Nitzschia punctata, Strain CCMP561" /LENGTH=441 /DNA_ID=CAMNT_0020496363 /DNA_START=173 /DNA_END=1495 /DNA_ORIENTATION=+